MKLKQQPEDFHVEEVTDLRPATHGPFAFYRLEKRGWTTPDAIAVIRKRWQLAPDQISFGGLKDRHAATSQHLTIFHGPRRGMKHQEIILHYVGQVGHPFTSEEITRNRFRLIVRNLAVSRRESIEANLQQLEQQGVPNYFDDQRFGSVSDEGGEFIAKLLVKGEFEKALRLAVLSPYEFDRAEQKREKELLAKLWGNWKACREKLPVGPMRDLMAYLEANPDDFRGAFARLRPELRGLYLSAYQSHLWNQMLARWLETHLPSEQLAPLSLRLGELPATMNLREEQLRELTALVLPLPSARLHLEPDDPMANLVNGVMAKEGLELRQMQIKGVRSLFFSRGERAALCLPKALIAGFADDEKHAGRLKLNLSFELPRGSYATLIVKRVCDRSSPAL